MPILQGMKLFSDMIDAFARAEGPPPDRLWRFMRWALAGSFAAASAALFSAAFAAAIPAINATRTPPLPGTANSCEVRVSPSTMVVA